MFVRSKLVAQHCNDLPDCFGNGMRFRRRIPVLPRAPKNNSNGADKRKARAGSQQRFEQDRISFSREGVFKSMRDFAVKRSFFAPRGGLELSPQFLSNAQFELDDVRFLSLGRFD